VSRERPTPSDHKPTLGVRRAVLAAASALTLLLSGCASGGTDPATRPPIEQPAPSSLAASSAVDPMTTPTVDGSFAVDGNRSLTLRCWGMGSPVIVYDAGSGTDGLNLWPTRSVMTAMAHTNQVCTYDRAGLGESDPARTANGCSTTPSMTSTSCWWRRKWPGPISSSAPPAAASMSTNTPAGIRTRWPVS
jgi:hypothetical protein